MTTGRPRKRYGQHFLHDQNIIDKIVDAIQPRSDEHLVEIGPGRGALTRPLAETVGRLDVIEIDRNLADTLRQSDWAGCVNVHCEDALKVEFSALAQPGRKIRLVGNLPYNISTPLLFHILASSEFFTDIHVMLQKEVVDRITAAPGNRTYGRLTVALAARCDAEFLFDIRPGSFTPRPKIESSFVRLRPLVPAKVSEDIAPTFNRILRQAFNMRRKKLSNALDGLLDASEIQSTGIDPGARAEQLDVDAFIRLSELWQRREQADVR